MDRARGGWLLWLFVAGLVLFAVLVLHRRQDEIRQLEANQHQVETEIARLEEDIDRLSTEIDGLENNPVEQERMVRERLGMLRTGEVVLKLETKP